MEFKEFNIGKPDLSTIQCIKKECVNTQELGEVLNSAQVDNTQNKHLENDLRSSTYAKEEPISLRINESNTGAINPIFLKCAYDEDTAERKPTIKEEPLDERDMEIDSLGTKQSQWNQTSHEDGVKPKVKVVATAMKHTKYYTDEHLMLPQNSEEFEHVEDNTADSISETDTAIGMVKEGSEGGGQVSPIRGHVAASPPIVLPSPVSPASSVTLIECTEERDGMSVMITQHKEQEPAEAVVLPVSTKRALYTSTLRPKRRRIMLTDEPSDAPDPDYIPDDSDEPQHRLSYGSHDSECDWPAQDAPPAAAVPPPSHSPPESTRRTSRLTPSPVTPSTSTDDASRYIFNLSVSQLCTLDKTVWSRTPRRQRTTAAQPAIPYTQGLTAKSRDAISASNFYSLFVTDDMVQNVVTYTNQRIDGLAPKYANQAKVSCGHTCSEEILALMGILIESGAKQDNKRTAKEMFDPLHGSVLYRAGLNESRFRFLLQAICFDDHTTRKEREKTDKMAAFRYMWETFVTNCQENYVPGEAITVDEQMLGFRGRCNFRFYTSKKPKKYGLKIISACDSSNGYMLNGIVDLGKHRLQQPVPGKIGEYYTMKLCEPYLDSNRTITVDNWFTSMPLADDLYKRRTTMVGTLQCKGYVPHAMIDTKMNRPMGTSIFLFRQNLTMVSYKPKQNKIVLLLSSKHNAPEIGEKNKPKIIHYYSKTKGGVDVMDNMCRRYSCCRKTQRWSLCLFYGLINLSVVNAFLLSKIKGGVKVRRIFMLTLASELVRPWAQMRIQQRGMRISLISAIKVGFNIVDERSVLDRPTTSHSKRRCAFCFWRTAKQTRIVCAHCDQPVCPDHSNVICQECQE